jgi:HSP20 family protein
MNGKRDDDWDDIFDDMYDEFGFDMKKINREIAKFWESVMKGESNSKVMGPYVYGFSYKLGPVFQEFGNVPRNGIASKAETREDSREPLTDINEDKENVYITYELPGVEKKDIDLIVNENNIELKVDKGTRKYYKNIEFNTEIDINSVIAKFTNGILDITIKKLDNKSNGRAVKIE